MNTLAPIAILALFQAIPISPRSVRLQSEQPIFAPIIEKVCSCDGWVTLTWWFPISLNDWKIRTMWNDRVITNELHFQMARATGRTNFTWRTELIDPDAMYAVQGISLDGQSETNWSYDHAIDNANLGSVMPQASSALPFMPSATISNPPAMPEVHIKP